MSLAFAMERRLLAENDLDPIRRSHFPLLEGLPRQEVQDLAFWLRARRNRARDLMREHRRAKRGKASREAERPPDADRGLAAKKQVFAGALKRVNARLQALLLDERRARNLACLRQALTRNHAVTPHHPATGPTQSKEHVSKPGKARPTIHGARIGSVSQSVRKAEARRDSQR